MDIIKAKNISHSYIFAQKEIKSLDNISFKINKGEFVSIVGKNGCGKSTLVKHLNALIPLQKGVLTVASLDCNNTKNIYKIRQKCGMVFQNPDNQFVSTVVKEDIEFSLKNYDIKYDDKTIDDALSLVGLKSFENRDIFSLSGGQKQRLCIARAILKSPKILILDDSTSAVDSATDARIRQGLRESLPSTTKIIIAQRVSSISDCDKIIILDNGTVNDIGTHEELLERNEIYRDVYTSQQKGTDDFDEVGGEQ